jgi:hypothetical protein
MIEIIDAIRRLIDNAMADGVPCLLGTVDGKGRPQIGPKGSVMVYDDAALAYWERGKQSAFYNIQTNPYVVVYYRNGAAGDVLPGGAVRFHGKAELYEDGPVRENVMARTIQGELDRDPERRGVAVLIQVDRIEDLGGNILQQRED